MAGFRARNLYYLRISKTTVIPLYRCTQLYLDERHLDWMSDRVLQHVLADLKPLIPAKLEAEADAILGPGGPPNAKRGTVDVHRGETWQCGFFLRNTEPHSVLIKTRDFVLAPPKPKVQNDSELRPPSPKAKKRGQKRASVPKKAAQTSLQKGAKAGKGKGRKVKAIDSDEESAVSTDEDVVETSRSIVSAPRRSTRRKMAGTGTYREGPDDEFDEMQQAGSDGIEIVDEKREVAPQLDDDSTIVIKDEEEEPRLDIPSAVSPPPPPPMDLEIDEDEETKPKPVLQLKYQGFDIAGRCLCVVVEPWPPIRSTTRAPSAAPSSRSTSIAPADFVSSDKIAARERTPLFLPDDDDDREETPFVPPPIRIRPPVPAFNDPPIQYNDEEEDELMQFSQVLSTTSGHRTGETDADDDLEGAVLFGDADEAREL